MAPSTLEGQTLGKYRLLNALGRGGMSRVYRGYHAQLDRYVAIKVLRADLMENAESLERFRREAHAVSGLRHPNIVQVFDFDVQDDLHYMVMELLDGDTLRARLHEHRGRSERMPLQEIVQILTSILAGLEYAHNEGIVHRDLKPANIMLTNKGQTILTDFGIAQMTGNTPLTVPGALMGSLHYMAPEQGLKGQCDERGDLYSLGIVLFEMLTGYPPYDADTPLAILMKHLNDPLPLPRQIDPDLPLAFEQLTLKALAKSPEDRFQSAGEMSDRLKSLTPIATPEPRPLVSPPGTFAHKAVFSGDSRQNIPDRPLTRQDTEQDIPGPIPQQQDEPGIQNLPLNRIIVKPPSALSAIMTSLSALVVFNLFTAMLLSVTGLNLYRYGWAFEIFLAAGFFTLLGWALSNPWLLNPAIILFGNASLIAYSALTGRWKDWSFLWLIEPLIIAASILLPLTLQKRAEGGAYLTKASNLYLTLITMLLSIGTCLLAFFVSLFR